MTFFAENGKVPTTSKRQPGQLATSAGTPRDVVSEGGRSRSLQVEEFYRAGGPQVPPHPYFGIYSMSKSVVIRQMGQKITFFIKSAISSESVQAFGCRIRTLLAIVDRTSRASFGSPYQGQGLEGKLQKLENSKICFGGCRPPKCPKFSAALAGMTTRRTSKISSKSDASSRIWRSLKVWPVWDSPKIQAPGPIKCMGTKLCWLISLSILEVTSPNLHQSFLCHPRTGKSNCHSAT